MQPLVLAAQYQRPAVDPQSPSIITTYHYQGSAPGSSSSLQVSRQPTSRNMRRWYTKPQQRFSEFASWFRSIHPALDVVCAIVLSKLPTAWWLLATRSDGAEDFTSTTFDLASRTAATAAIQGFAGSREFQTRAAASLSAPAVVATTFRVWLQRPILETDGGIFTVMNLVLKGLFYLRYMCQLIAPSSVFACASLPVSGNL